MTDHIDMSTELRGRICEVLRHSCPPWSWDTTTPEHVADELIDRLGLTEFTCGSRSSEVPVERWWATAIQTVNATNGEWQ